MFMRLIFTALILIFGSAAALACDCMGFSSPEDHIANADVVFVGIAKRTYELKKAEDSFESTQSTQFEIIEILKGDIDGQEISILHSPHDGVNCGVDFNVGDLYEVFANEISDGQLGTSGCITAVGYREIKGWSWDDYRRAAKKH